jgi:hypothetical protein
MSTFSKKKLRLEQTTMGAPSVGAGGHIDVALGTFDRPGPNPQKDMEKAIVPTEMVATQLATERPPIEDDDYVPSSIAELAIASSEMAKLIPPEQVKKFYLKMKELADECVERAEITTLDGKYMQESKKRKVVKMIQEALDDLDSPVPGADPNRALVSFPDIIKAHPEEFEDVKPHRRYTAALKASQSGIGKLKSVLETIPEDELDKLHKVAKDEYIDLFEEVVGDDADPADVADLKKLPPDVLYEMSDAYKFFFKAAFILPNLDKYDKAFRKASASAVDDAQSKIAPLKVPPSAQATVIYQMLGFSSRDPQAVKEKYQQASVAGEIKPEEVEMRYKALMSKYGDIQVAARKGMLDARNDATKVFIRDALDNYSKMSLEDRKNLMMQAFEKMG